MGLAELLPVPMFATFNHTACGMSQEHEEREGPEFSPWLNRLELRLLSRHYGLKIWGQECNSEGLTSSITKLVPAVWSQSTQTLPTKKDVDQAAEADVP